MGVLCFPDLKEKGIPWTRQHVSKLVRLKRFPKPFKLGDKTNAWTDEQIDEYLKSRIAMRDAKVSVLQEYPNAEPARSR